MPAEKNFIVTVTIKDDQVVRAWVVDERGGGWGATSAQAVSSGLILGLYAASDPDLASLPIAEQVDVLSRLLGNWSSTPPPEGS